MPWPVYFSLAARAARFSDRALYEAMTGHLFALKRDRSDDPALTAVFEDARRAAYPAAAGEPDTIPLAPLPPDA